LRRGQKMELKKNIRHHLGSVIALLLISVLVGNTFLAVKPANAINPFPLGDSEGDNQVTGSGLTPGQLRYPPQYPNVVMPGRVRLPNQPYQAHEIELSISYSPDIPSLVRPILSQRRLAITGHGEVTLFRSRLIMTDDQGNVLRSFSAKQLAEQIRPMLGDRKMIYLDICFGSKTPFFGNRSFAGQLADELGIPVLSVDSLLAQEGDYAAYASRNRNVANLGGQDFKVDKPGRWKLERPGQSGRIDQARRRGADWTMGAAGVAVAGAGATIEAIENRELAHANPNNPAAVACADPFYRAMQPRTCGVIKP
jgi:hypothetical protein